MTHRSARRSSGSSSERAIEPLYQPVASLTTGRLIGYEALARFPDAPDRPPSTWFAQANACGLGPELEAAAIQAALDRDRSP